MLTFLEFFLALEKASDIYRPPAVPADADLDHQLLYDLNCMTDGANIHGVSNLLQRYKGAISMMKTMMRKEIKDQKTLDSIGQLWSIAQRAESEIRALINKKRMASLPAAKFKTSYC